MSDHEANEANEARSSQIHPIAARPRRATPRRPRMLAAGRRDVTQGASRVSLRIAIPERLVRMTEFGLLHASDDGSGWWRQVEREMHALVDAHVPSTARNVDLRLDPERLEVVVEYQHPTGPRRLARTG